MKKKKIKTSKIKKNKTPDALITKKSSDKIAKYQAINLNNKSIPGKRIGIIALVIFITMILLIVKIGWIQFVEGASLKEMASRQQTINEVINPKRGSIYDTNGKALAISAAVDTISINPAKIKDEHKETIAHTLSDIFGLDYEDTLNKCKSTSSVVTIAKKVEQDKVTQLKEWMNKKENKKIVSGINIDEDSKRYYPYDNLASHIIGFTGTDSQGLYGIESKWNSTLEGLPGKIVTVADVHSSEISEDASQYVAVENGSDLYLTLDVNIQSILEKYLAQGVASANASSGSVIAMDPSTGDILGMATYPSYNLNDPFTLTSSYAVDNMTPEQKTNSLYEMWSDKNISSTYEPGSTFKTIMAAIALEENITSVNIANDFHCTGSIEVADRVIRCASHEVHGNQTLKQALANSCNVSFIQLGQRIGTNTLYKYFSAFGLFEKTGIGITGEYSSVFHPKNDVGPVELATISFGQRFEITPLQLITAVSAIANGGTLMQPRIVKQVVTKDSNNQISKNIDVTPVRTVISKETAEKVCDMMGYVVTDGSGKKAAVKGYYIGGKTGTAENTYTTSTGKYGISSVSFLAIAPYKDAKITLLVVLYNPQTTSAYGSTLVAPVVSNMLSEILPYLGIASEDATSSSSPANELITVPDIKNKTVTEATKILQASGLKVTTTSSGDPNSTLVTEQVPSSGSQIYLNSTVVLYTPINTIRTSVVVPDLTTLSLAQARSVLSNLNLNLKFVGNGTVSSQDIQPSSSVEEGTIITVTLK